MATLFGSGWVDALRPLTFCSLMLLSLQGSVEVCVAEWLDLGGRRIELVNGNVSDTTAKEVLTYSRNLYDRGDYKGSQNSPYDTH